MSKQNTTNPSTSILVSGASIIVIIAGLKSAQPIVVPFILSVFIAMICAGPMFWLKSKKMGTVTAISIIALAIIGFGSLVGYIFGSSLNDFSKTLPEYNLSFNEILNKGTEYLENYGIQIPEEAILKHVNPSAAMELVTSMLSELSGMLGNAFLILTAVIFMLLEASTIPNKIKNVLGNSQEKTASLKKFSESFKKYMSIKTLISFATGAIIAISLYILNIDYPLLWGLLAFLLNYIPNIGSVLATIPIVLMALVTAGTGKAIAALIICMIVNTVLGNFLEPKFLGKGLGLSTLIVFLSLVFWGWVLGPVGMLLSVPLTMTFKIALESNPQTKKIADLLG